jgi:dethiobiotin synthetase/adenosylmethionine--8-amino-7-oxononanoate aminotransferase
VCARGVCALLAVRASHLTATRGATGVSGARLRELWEPALVEAVRVAPGVARVVCIGTVFAAELQPLAGSAGYQSNAARGVVKRLRKHGARWRHRGCSLASLAHTRVRAGIFARPLGNVIYLMVTPLAPPATCARLLTALLAELQAPDAGGDSRRAVVC